MHVLTFNLHTQYLYLLSQTGWDIDNLVVTPEEGVELLGSIGSKEPWHTMPYGYPTHPGAVNAMPGVPYGYLFPPDINQPPALWMAPPVPNITNIRRPAEDYDMIVYITLSRMMYRPPEGSKAQEVYVNLSGEEKPASAAGVDFVVHVPRENQHYIPIGVPDDFLPRVDDTEGVLACFGSAKLRPAEARTDIYTVLRENVPFHLHDMFEDPWDYWKMRDALSRFLVFVSVQDTPGGPPLTLIEAMMSGMPAVVWDPHGHLAEYKHFEHCWKVSNAAQATVACKRLIGDPELRTRIGKAGQALTRERHSIDLFVEGWKKLASG